MENNIYRLKGLFKRPTRIFLTISRILLPIVLTGTTEFVFEQGYRYKCVCGEREQMVSNQKPRETLTIERVWTDHKKGSKSLLFQFDKLKTF